ncbi:MAG: hypothetical protein ABIJ40_08195 [Bacteroidota bacterium]|nr:hypothetical protein [Bacteroidota bacterium]
MGRASLIMFFGALLVFGIANVTKINTVSQATDVAVEYYSEIQNRNISNSTAEYLISYLGDNPTYVTSHANSLSIFYGNATYTIADTSFSGSDYKKLKIYSDFHLDTKSSEILVQVPVQGFIPTTVQASVSSRSPISTLGNLTVDGRDHDITGTSIISNSGTFGVWTTSTLSIGGSSQIGGTKSGLDYVPSGKPGNPNTYSEGASYSGGYPDNPDSALGGKANGFPPGALKSKAQSGANGSQYTTNPASLTMPLRGVTYVELASNSKWEPNSLTGSGILIVHNTSFSASLAKINGGKFTGLVIVDHIDKVHGDIVGGIIVLSDTPPKDDEDDDKGKGKDKEKDDDDKDGGEESKGKYREVLGNGNGKILYSNAAIKFATSTVSSTTTQNYGWAKKRLTAIRWYE